MANTAPLFNRIAWTLANGSPDAGGNFAHKRRVGEESSIACKIHPQEAIA